MVTTHCPSCQPPVGPRVPQGHHGARGQGGSHCTNDNPLLDHKNTEEDTKGETSKGETSMGQLAPSSRYSAIFEPAGHRLVHGPAQNQITQPQNGPGNTQTSSLAGGGGGFPSTTRGLISTGPRAFIQSGSVSFPRQGTERIPQAGWEVRGRAGFQPRTVAGGAGGKTGPLRPSRSCSFKSHRLES